LKNYQFYDLHHWDLKTGFRLYNPLGLVHSSRINIEYLDIFTNVSGIISECPICFNKMNKVQNDTVNCPDCKNDIHITCIEEALYYKKMCNM